jgi:hypothetical protein
MSAQPKNKITRVEQGKRRAGNRPDLTKDTHSAKVPAHKLNVFKNMLSMFEKK